MEMFESEKTRSNKMQTNTISTENRIAIKRRDTGEEKKNARSNDQINYSLVFNDFQPHLVNANAATCECVEAIRSFLNKYLEVSTKFFLSLFSCAVIMRSDRTRSRRRDGRVW